MFYFSYYLSEIRKRFFYLGISWIACLLLSYVYRIELLYLFSRPFLDFHNKFIFLDLTEAFYTTVNICIVFSLFCIFPYCLYQIWSFLIPSFYLFEREIVNLLLRIFFLLFFLEILVIYFILFPKVCEFLMKFEIKTFELALSVELSARIQSYLFLFIRFFSFCLLVLQVPFLFFFFYKNKIVNCYQLCKNRKMFFVGALLVSAFISPPDLLNQCILTIILLSFFEFLIFLGFILEVFEMQEKIL